MGVKPGAGEGGRALPIYGQAPGRLPARRQGINYSHMAGLQDGFIKTAPFNAKARSPRSLRAVQRALFSFGFHTAPPTPRLTPFLPLPPLSKPAEFPLQPRHELQPKNNFRPPLSSQRIWGRHPGLPFPPYPP